MKKKQKKTWKSIPFKKEDMKWYTFEEVFAKASKTKEFQRGYAAESQRLELARQLRDSRRAKRMTQKNVADKASMPQSVIARLESGEHSASIATLGKVATALGKQIALIDAT
jgi:ribosome-binding protein aMBF1 (putative translation factor)